MQHSLTNELCLQVSTACIPAGPVRSCRAQIRGARRPPGAHSAHHRCLPALPHALASPLQIAGTLWQAPPPVLASPRPPACGVAGVQVGAVSWHAVPRTEAAPRTGDNSVRQGRRQWTVLRWAQVASGRGNGLAATRLDEGVPDGVEGRLLGLSIGQVVVPKQLHVLLCRRHSGAHALVCGREPSQLHGRPRAALLRRKSSAPLPLPLGHVHCLFPLHCGSFSPSL